MGVTEGGVDDGDVGGVVGVIVTMATWVVKTDKISNHTVNGKVQLTIKHTSRASCKVVNYTCSL